MSIFQPWISDDILLDQLAQGWLSDTRHFLPRLEQTQILQSSLQFPASLAQKVMALKPTSSSAMQIDSKLWLSNEAEKVGVRSRSRSALIYFRLAAQTATVLSANLFAWWMVPQHEWTEKLQRWRQPALNSCLGDEPEGPAQPFSTEWGRLTTGKKERNPRNNQLLTRGSLAGVNLWETMTFHHFKIDVG